MNNETLTTAPAEEQVNTDENQVVESEQNQPEVSISADTQEPDEAGNDDAYSKAWDEIDVNNLDAMPEMEPTTAEEHVEVNLEEVEPASTEDIKETMNAFMTDKPVIKYKGKEIPIDSPDELIALAQKGFSYETEMAKLKPQKKVLKVIEGIPVEVLQAVKDLHSGNKGAIEYLAEKYDAKIVAPKKKEDSFFDDDELEEEIIPVATASYKPEVPSEDPVKDWFSSFTEANPSEAGKVNEIYSELDESFKSEIYKPDIFPIFVNSVVTGEFEDVYPLALKEKTLNPALSWLQAYQVAANKIGDVKAEPQKPQANVSAPKPSKQNRNVSGESQADRVWEDDSYFKELEKEIFGY